MKDEEIESMRKAGECHKQIRKYAQTIIKPGIKSTFCPGVKLF